MFLVYNGKEFYTEKIREWWKTEHAKWQKYYLPD